MEGFNPQNYRDNLAKDLKDIRKDDPEKAQEVLEYEKGGIRYQEAEKVHKNKKEVEQMKGPAEKLADNVFSKLFDRDILKNEMSPSLYFSSNDKKFEFVKKYLEDRNVPLNLEKSITDVFEDGTMEINGEKVDVNIFSARNVSYYSSPRKVIISPTDLYIEIVPEHGIEYDSYAHRFKDIPNENSGKDISTVLLKGGIGIAVENTDLYSSEKITPLEQEELVSKINNLLRERLEIYQRYEKMKDIVEDLGKGDLKYREDLDLKDIFDEQVY